jgi:hypothetical protein
MPDELYTPKFIFDALKLEFDLDVCCPPQGPLYTPAKKFYSLLDDGLNSNWSGRVWMNPPFSKPSPWIDKWLDHNNGLALTLIGGNGKWLNKLWASEAAALLLQPNCPFINEDGIEKKMMYRVGLWAIGETNITALKMSGLGVIR